MRWSIGFQRCGWGHCVRFVVIIPILSRREKVLSHQGRRGGEARGGERRRYSPHSPLPTPFPCLLPLHASRSCRDRADTGKVGKTHRSPIPLFFLSPLKPAIPTSTSIDAFSSSRPPPAPPPRFRSAGPVIVHITFVLPISR